MTRVMAARVGSRLLVALLLVAAVAAGLATASAAAQEAASAQVDLLYVCNQDDATVDVVDIARLEVVRTVDLQAHGFGPTAKPHHVVVEPDGSFWYVSLIGENRVVKFDAEDRLMGSVEFETPGMLALHPDGRLLLVGRSMSAVNPPQRIGVIDRRTMEGADEMDVFFPRPHALAIGASSGIAYTASLGANQMAAVDVADDVLELIDLEGPQHALMQFAISPDGATLVASAELSGRLLVFDLSDPLRPVLRHSIEVDAQPFDPLFTRDGAWVYVPAKAADTVTVIDASSWSVVEVIEHEALVEPHGTVNSPDGRLLFVSSNNVGGGGHDMHAAGHQAVAAEPEHETHADPRLERRGSVVVFDTVTHQVVGVIAAGRNTTGLGARQPVVVPLS